MNLQLIVYNLVTKKKKVHNIELEQSKPFTIGRTFGDLLLDDSKSSKRHCSLRFENRQIKLTDLDSSNGTKVNNKKITQTVNLGNGDTFKIGCHKIGLRFSSIKEASPISVKVEQVIDSGFFDDFSFKKFIEEYFFVYKGFRDQPLHYFQDRVYNDQLSKSVFYLFTNFTLIGLSSFSSEGAVNAFTSFCFVVAVSYILSFTKSFTKLDGGFSQVLSFFAVYSTLTMPVSICANIAGIGVLGGILEFLFMLWGAYAFWGAFGYKFIRMVILQVFIIIGALFIFSWLAPQAYEDEMPKIDKDILRNLSN